MLKIQGFFVLEARQDLFRALRTLCAQKAAMKRHLVVLYFILKQNRQYATQISGN